jgi:TonB-linked SusC/RagA family outer membrane protein
MRSALSRFLAACALAGLPALAQAQQQTVVSGRVTGEAGAPVQGASVGIPQIGVGGLSNAEGEYSFTVPAANASGTARLVARRIGYQPYTADVALTGGTVTHDIVLERSVVQLQEIVSTALGIEREKRSLGVAQQQVAGEELAESRETNIINSLTGKVSGVTITNSGPQGGSSRIVIRGASSISGNNQPLFIIDGVPVDNTAPTTEGFGGGNAGGVDYGNAAQDINPNDIESVSILKGPNAAALYGSRASNGAIIITTKSGKGSQGYQVTVNQSLSFETPLRLPDYQNEYGQGSGAEPSRLVIDPTGEYGGCDPTDPDYATCGFSFVDGTGAGVNDGVDESWGPALDGTIRSQFFGDGPWVANPDNVRDFFEMGRTSTTNLSLSGATDRTNVRFSGTYLNQQGMYPSNVLERMTAQFNGGTTLTDRLSADASLQYVRNEGKDRPGTGYDAGNFMEQFVWFGRQVDVSRLRDYKDAEGNMFNWNYNYHDNPYWEAFENSNWDTRDRIIGSGLMRYKATDWLTGQVRAGTDFYRDYRKRTYAVGTLNNNPDGAFAENNIYLQETNVDFLLTAQRPLTTTLSTTLNFGGNTRFNTFKRSDVGASALLVPGIYNLSNAAVQAAPFDSLGEKRVNSLYGQAQFGFKDYLFVDVTGRNDWSSTLPEENNSYFYPSVSTSFIFTDAMPGLRFGDALEYGKLRASWTRVGNDADPYQTRDIFPGQTTFSGIGRSAVSNTIANPELRPEETTAWEVGTELRFFDRITLDATYYDKSTADQIVAIPITATTGYRSTVLNAGRITNKGIELLLDATPVRLTNGFRWNSTVNFAQNESRVEELASGIETLVLQDYWSLTVEARVGEKYGALVGYPLLRDDQGRLIVDGGLPQSGDDKVVLGHYTPDWTAGWNNSFSFRGVDFSFLFDWKHGGQIYSTTAQWGRYAGVLEETLAGRDTGILVQGVNADGTPNTTHVAAEDYWHTLWSIHEANVFDASYVKLREMKLGYTVPGNFAARVGASSMYLSLIGRNLWLSTDVPHIDPETAFASGNVQGLEFAQFPTARSIGFNITVTP